MGFFSDNHTENTTYWRIQIHTEYIKNKIKSKWPRIKHHGCNYIKLSSCTKISSVFVIHWILLKWFNPTICILKDSLVLWPHQWKSPWISPQRCSTVTMGTCLAYIQLFCGWLLLNIATFSMVLVPHYVRIVGFKANLDESDSLWCLVCECLWKSLCFLCCWSRLESSCATWCHLDQVPLGPGWVISYHI